MAPAPILKRVFNVLRRVARHTRYLVKRLFGRPLHIHIQNRWRIGDEIIAMPFYTLVRERYPHARITVAVNHPELLTGNDAIEVTDDVSEFDCDRYLFIQHDPRSTNRVQFLCRRFRIPYRGCEPHIDLGDEGQAAGDGVRIGYSVGAGWTCKSAPVPFMHEVLTLLAERYPQVEYVEVGKGCPSVGLGETLIDKCDLMETARVLSDCLLYIGPDSGLIHLALAVGTPALGLYGPVKPLVAFGHRTGLFTIRAPVTCQGCWTAGRMYEPGCCPRGFTSDDPQDYPCMGSIKADAVLAKIEKMGIFSKHE